MARDLLRDHFAELEIAITQLGPASIATHLYARRMIAQTTFHRVTSVFSVLTDRERATILLQAVELVVMWNPLRLKEFISVLETLGEPCPPVVPTLRARFRELCRLLLYGKGSYS